MSYITTTATIIITLVLSTLYGPITSNSFFKFKQYTRNITLKQGHVIGVIVGDHSSPQLLSVEQFKGIPYAAPPVGEMRFMPPVSPPKWKRTLYADAFAPVCPQVFPEVGNLGPEKRAEFDRLKKHLHSQSEDCLYLNIYAPHQEPFDDTRKYPVMVYIHGESFEWNSGNAYDGSILAAHGEVIVVTLNFRLGVLGFLQTGIEPNSKGNFGLIDQIAALVWVKDNIAAFGGDPHAVTLFGHGTGAACINLLMLSPMILHGGIQLAHRAILMAGSALSDWALATSPRQVTYEVARALNCPIDDNFVACLRRKRLDEMTSVSPVSSPYGIRFGPVVDHLVVQDYPKKLMTTYNDVFRRFQLMYGVTELESIHLLGSKALAIGMLEEERDQELGNYLALRCEMRSELCIKRTIAKYADQDDETYGRSIGSDFAVLTRDIFLDILSDARTVAPIVQMAEYHSAFNKQSYFYIFAHRSKNKNRLRNKSFNGEELSYVFGLPLGRTNFSSSDQDNLKETLFSEIIMTYFTNFAYVGNPNKQQNNKLTSWSSQKWNQYDSYWPTFDKRQRYYLQLEIPLRSLSNYRNKEMNYWNREFIELSTNYTTKHDELPIEPIRKTPRVFPPQNRPPFFITQGVYTQPSSSEERSSAPDNLAHDIGINRHGPAVIVTSPSTKVTEGSATNILVIVGLLFLLANLIFFFIMYYKCYRAKKNHQSNEPKQHEEHNNTDTIEEIHEKNERIDEEGFIEDGCNLMKIITKSSKSDDTYEAVKTNSNKFKLVRQMSTSTIDAHTKVRDWITQEIVNKYSPKFLRRSRHPHFKPETVVVQKQQSADTEVTETVNLESKSSTLNKSPTRPVSPSDNLLIGDTFRPILMKSSSIPTQGKQAKKPEKVSVAIDATPAGRGSSVLKQQPIELTKSLDRSNFMSDPSLRRSVTLEDFTLIKADFRRSSTSIDFNKPSELPSVPINELSVPEPTIIRIEHSHSRSEPVQDLYSCTTKKMKTFDSTNDNNINVTSRDETISPPTPLTPEESLMTIKRRNFPKVLPDYPKREAIANKRRSMPIASHLFMPIPEFTMLSQLSPPGMKLFNNKLPPAPPPRTTSNLGKNPGFNNNQPVCQSAPVLAAEPPASPEPELTYNNLYFGPLIPKLNKTSLSASDSSKLNTQPVYESLRLNQRKVQETPKTVVTADPYQPIRKVDPKIIIKPTMIRALSDPKHKHIPRVVVNDNLPVNYNPNNNNSKDDHNAVRSGGVKDDGGNGDKFDAIKSKLLRPSHIPTPVKNLQKESSSSDSTPSEESDTETVVKRI